MDGGRGSRAGMRHPGAADGQKSMSPANVRAGVTYAQRDARRLLEDALLLYGKGRFRGAIRLAILSIEESLKGVSLGFALDEQRAVTSEEWKDLKRHRHKLGHVPSRIARGVESDGKSGTQVHVSREVGAAGGGEQATVRVCIVRNAWSVKELVRNLQRVKEMCVYEEWDSDGSMHGVWNLDDEESEALALFVLELAKMHHEIPNGGAGFALGTLAPKDPTPEGSGGEGRRPGAAGHDSGKMQRGEEVLRRLSSEIDARVATEKRDDMSSV